MLRGQRRSTGSRSLQAWRGAKTMKVCEANVCTVMIVGLRHREDDIRLSRKGERLAYLQPFAVDLQGYFGRSVDETIERTRDDHGFSLAIPADDARVL